MTILINDILNLKNLENTKIRFLVPYVAPNQTVDPKKLFNNDRKEILNWLFWNFGKKLYKVGQTAIGFVRIEKDKSDYLKQPLVAEKLTSKSRLRTKSWFNVTSALRQ